MTERASLINAKKTCGLMVARAEALSQEYEFRKSPSCTKALKLSSINFIPGGSSRPQCISTMRGFFPIHSWPPNLCWMMSHAWESADALCEYSRASDEAATASELYPKIAIE
ncbi:hypothetical protein AC579_9525 [Pseudocercospora musae]|uniref:Uncharacterized protein n=1 Tax=Pseudocercospora musae TaxID=113226 RepID=A0A139IMQ6_9PEZI|nr:hypothetical protein AC579_9525 [Pseudocercospora musae]